MGSTRWLLQSSRERGSNRRGGAHPERLGDPRIRWGGGLPQSIGQFQLPANGVGSCGRVIERLADLRESDFELLMPRTWKLNANSSCHDSDATFALSRTPTLYLPKIGVPRGLAHGDYQQPAG